MWDKYTTQMPPGNDASRGHFVLYFILDYFEPANIIPSILSVTTTFIAVYLTFRRSPYFALVYAANDVVLILLWAMAAAEDISYLSVLICFRAIMISP